jgi:hypothetical protein
VTLLRVDPDQLPLAGDELDVLAQMLSEQGQPLQAQAIIELGCGNARLSCGLVQRYPNCTVTGLEVDAVQHAKNLARAPVGVKFVAAGAQAVYYASFDEFAKRMLYLTFADHGIDETISARARALFVRPMHVRLLRRHA